MWATISAWRLNPEIASHINQFKITLTDYLLYVSEP
jgi:hypothetical protein